MESPALAKVVTRQFQKTEVHCYAPKQPGSLIIMVGKRDAKEQIFSGISRACAELGPNWLERAVATIAYLCRHQGEHTIGGSPSVAVCTRNELMYWPFVVIEDKRTCAGSM
jgi:hypothetical protein